MLENIFEHKAVLEVYEVGGSVQKNKFKDIDLLIILEDDSKELFQLYIKNSYNTEKIDDSIRILNKDYKDINLALYYENEIIKKINVYTELNSPLGEKREWTIGYWIPEIFINDILNSKILYTNTNKNIKNTALNKKKEIEKNIVDKIKKEIYIKIALLEENKFINDSLKVDVIMSLLRLKQLKKSNKRKNFLDLIRENNLSIEKLYNLNNNVFKNNVENILKEMK